jgi:hypothetical protein
LIDAAATAVVNDLTTGITSIRVTANGSNYYNEPIIVGLATLPGITSAILEPQISNGSIQSIYFRNTGVGYTNAPALTLERSSGIGTTEPNALNYQYNEEVVGSVSSVTARVRDWNANTGILKVGINSGTFRVGEIVIGSASTARRKVASYETFDETSPYDQNNEFEDEGLNIIDFTESNPFRRTIVAFGTLFNNIHVQHADNNGNVIDDIKVPLAYGPQQKFLAKIQQQSDLSKPVAITLPRMSFEMTGITMDVSRKTTVTKTFKAVTADGNDIRKVYLPVPYNIDFELSVFAKLNDDVLQITEQILPFFQPSFNLTVDLVSSIGEKKDIPVVLNSINMQDDYEGDFSSRRSIIYTFRFTAKTYLFGPIEDSAEGLIRKVQVDYYTDTNTASAKREVRYTAVPDPINAEPDDDFGFSETYEFLQDSKTYSPTQQKDI